MLLPPFLKTASLTFSTSSNHYILAKFKDPEKISKEILSKIPINLHFLFKIDDSIFDRPLTEKTNFVSIYYLEYGDSKSDFEMFLLMLLEEKKYIVLDLEI